MKYDGKICLFIVGCTLSSLGNAITLNNVASPEIGISYQRTPSRTRTLLQDLRNETLNNPLVVDFSNPDREEKWKNIAKFPIETYGWPGVAVFDYDGDGDLDIYVTNGPGSANSLYSNQLVETGRLKFVDVAVHAGVAARLQDSSGVCYGDIDNDGNEDLFVVGMGTRNRLFLNQGDGSFHNITSTSGVMGDNRNSTSCSMGDINGDGLLDIFIANSMPRENTLAAWIVPWELNEHNQLFKNIGNHQFIDVSEHAGILTHAGLAPLGLEQTNMPTVTWAVAMVDYDLDGDADIITADDNIFIPPYHPIFSPLGVTRGLLHVFQNDGSGHFQDRTVEAGANIPGSWMGLSFSDLDSDGNMDMFATNAGDYISNTMTTIGGGQYILGTSASRWLLGQPDGSFVDPGVAVRGASTFGWGTSSTDVDNDGDTDIIYYGNHDIILFATADNPGVVLVNDGAGHMEFDASIVPMDNARRNVHGLAVGDLNMDGYPDVISASSFDRPAPIPMLPTGVAYGTSADPGPFDPFANVFVQFAPIDLTDPTKLAWTGIEFPGGSLAIELNSADTRHHWIRVQTVGTKGLTSHGKVNRSGIGAVVQVTPVGGKTAMQPIIGGASYLSQDSLSKTFGLGFARSAKVDILWPGGTKNRWYGIRNKESILFPEIPCGYDQFDGDYRGYLRCVNTAIRELKANDTIDETTARRIHISALIAYNSTHNID